MVSLLYSPVRGTSLSYNYYIVYISNQWYRYSNSLTTRTQNILSLRILAIITPESVIRFPEILQQCCGAATFLGGSGSGS